MENQTLDSRLSPSLCSCHRFLSVKSTSPYCVSRTAPIQQPQHRLLTLPPSTGTVYRASSIISSALPQTPPLHLRVNISKRTPTMQQYLRLHLPQSLYQLQVLPLFLPLSLPLPPPLESATWHRDIIISILSYPTLYELSASERLQQRRIGMSQQGHLRATLSGCTAPYCTVLYVLRVYHWSVAEEIFLFGLIEKKEKLKEKKAFKKKRKEK